MRDTVKIYTNRDSIDVQNINFESGAQNEFTLVNGIPIQRRYSRTVEDEFKEMAANQSKKGFRDDMIVVVVYEEVVCN